MSQTGRHERKRAGESLPPGWTTRRLKTVLLEQLKYGANEAADSDNPDDPRFVRITDIGEDGRLKPDTFRSLPAEVAQPYLLKDGDLLFARSGATVGKSTIYSESWGPCCFAGYLIRARPDTRKVLPQYLRYFCESAIYWQHIASEQIQATIQNVSAERYGNLRVPMPDVAGQLAIVHLLDREISKIDALTGKQVELIDTLREDRTATITHAVTKGVDPRVEMKDAGLEWVCDVPRHWQVVNIRRVAVMKTGHTPSRSVAAYWENTKIPWFTLADVWQLRDSKRIYLGDTSNCISELGLANSAAELLPKGTVVLSRTASVGFTGIMPTPMATSQDYWNWICGPQLLPEYLMYVFRAMRSYFSALMIGSTHQTIYQADAAAIRIPLPPVSEQQEIVQRIYDAVAATDALSAKANEVIETLREYRSTLITDAVTGKIDVRQAV